MTDDKFAQNIELTYLGTVYVPVTPGAADHLASLSGKEIKETECCFMSSNIPSVKFAMDREPGEIVHLSRVIARDLSFHKSYMGFLGYIWDYLPDKFQEAVPKNTFYKFLKHLKGQYEIKYRFKDDHKREGIKGWLKLNKKRFRLTYKNIDEISDLCSKMELIEYESISFGRMDENKFREYVRNQLPFIYQVIGKFYSDEEYDNIVSTIERDWENFFKRL